MVNPVISQIDQTHDENQAATNYFLINIKLYLAKLFKYYIFCEVKCGHY